MNALEQEVKAELEDARFTDRRHGTHSCYRAGCRGPLCKREVRRIRRKYRDSKSGGYMSYLDEVLAPLQEQHDQDFNSREKASA